jgi:hypothetical protein
MSEEEIVEILPEADHAEHDADACAQIRQALVYLEQERPNRPLARSRLLAALRSLLE